MNRAENPTIRIFVHRKTGDCILLSFCVHPKLRMVTACGKLQHVARSYMAEYGLRTVLENLAAFPDRRDEERSEYECLSASERKRLEKDYADVSVVLNTPSEITMTLMKPWGGAGGAVGGPEDSRTVSLAVSPREFYRVLLLTAGVGPLPAGRR